MADPKDIKRLIEEAKGSSGRYDPMRAQRVSEYEKGFRDYLAAQQEARESLFKPSPTVGGMAKGAAGALAGYAAQVPGIVGDVLSLYDEFKPDRAPNLPEWARAIPTTERLQEYYLPENASPELQAGVTGGNLFALGQGVAALPKVVAGGARMAGRGAKALAPTANQMLENYMLKTGQMLPLNVYHGSPHRFAPTPKNPLGEFDPTKIGTGEGAQAYGYGHYLAEAPGVAKTYQPRSPEYEQKLLEKYNRAQAKRDYTTMEILEDAMLHRSPDEIIQRFTNAEDGYTPAHAKAARDFVNWYAKNPPEVGGLYKVDLPDEQIAKMLDWDKPLSEQAPEVQKAIKKIPAFNELKKTARLRVPEGRNIDNWSVSFLHKALQDQAGKLNMKPDEIAAALRESGIPGIRYLDQGSRGAGEGTRNFVVFPGGESMLNIISREKKGGMVSEDAMRMKSWDKQIQRKAKGGEVTQAEIDAASKPYRMPAPKRRGSIDASGAKAAGTLLSGIASAVPAGYAGLLELARTRDPKMAADAVEALQERYMSMPEDERTAKKIERLSGALETLGEPARLVGETTLRATGSPLAATIAELGLDPMNYLPLIGKAPAAARAAKKAAQNLGPVADQMLENYMLRTGMALPVSPATKAAKEAAKALASAGKSADELAEVRKVAPEGQQNVQEILEPKSNVFKPKRVQTVSDAQRMAFPGIYQRPDVIAAEAASRVAPENPALKQLFGVTREDLYQLGKSRQGNLPGELPGQAANPRGSAAAEGVMTRRNRQRILDVNAEAEKYPLLVQGMDPWYVMDPLYKRMVELLGPEQANIEYRKMNTLVGMASPGSEVLVEIPRGTAAYYLQKQGRFPEFIEHIGKPEELRKDVPADIVNVPGHVYHRTAQAIPMSKFIESGVIDMTSPKVPMYIEASQVPEIGFQTRTPVGDAHWSRAVGLADTRGARTSKGKEVIPGGSVSNPEMTQLAPWWRERIAKELGIESVPAQARTWGVFSGQTGVTTPIGAPKLELMAQKIMETANRLGVSPETARDMVILGETYAGKKKGGKVEKKAEGGLTSDDLILEERKL